MRFVCDRCGKKYATAEDPAPGKVYKLKCKACGHLIVVKGQAGTMTAIPAITAAEVAAATQATEPLPTPVPGPHPEIELQVEPEAVSDDAIEALPPASDSDLPPLPPEVALAVDAAAGSEASRDQAEPPEASPSPLDPALTPPPPDKDELADFAAAAAEVVAAPSPGATGPARPAVPSYVDIFGESGVMKPVEDSFAAAARASLPDSWAGPAPVAPPAAPRPAPPTLASARPPATRGGLGGMPVAIIGVGILALVGITAWALIGRGNGSPPQTTETPAPAAVPELKPDRPKPPEPAIRTPIQEAAAEKKALVPEAPSEPTVAEKKPEARPEAKPRPPERKVEKKPEPKVAERKPEPPRPPPALEPRNEPRNEPRTEPREAAGPDAAAVLTPDVMNRVIGANRKAFAACIASGGGSGVALDGRRVALRITINNNGTVTYPTLDDQSLNATEMGQCLKSAARLMIFPKFTGDPSHYEVPLVLEAG